MNQKTTQQLLSRLAVIASLVCVFSACQKETSLEKGLFNGAAEGELIDSLGLCKNITVNGTYKVDTALNENNYVIVNVNFTSAGKYKIYSDTVNGMWFIDSGFVVNSGQNAIKLKGKGTPILPKLNDFAVFYGNNMCSFSINTDGSASGGSGGSGGINLNNDYFPLTAGSNWQYDFIPDVGNIDTFTVITSSQQVQVQGDPLVYYQFGTRLKDTFYFARSNTGDYYALSSVDFDYTLLFDSIPGYFLSYIFLKPNGNAGDTWETAEYGKVRIDGSSGSQRGMAKAVFTIISKNTTPHTVGGKTYDNVINIKRDIMFKPDGGSYQLLVSGNSFYAKGYGLIDQVIGSGSNGLSMPVYRVPEIK